MGRGDCTEENVLEDYGLLRQTQEIAVVFVCGGVIGCLLFDSRPGEVDIEEKEENAEAYYGGLCCISKHLVGERGVHTSN